ncbi:large ribosomal subunit protein mL42 [Danio rerio]|uniref:Large ribosomal subunit protein mL42 n=1 Tax=Danio rerio TaxID=7955 RepID=F1Q839_DANRE|nr:39S ribosomal protein L42, mitochondrial [Danio rerio]|eukprot:NP_001314748.1 39S ribosomal protein L42, mitochondrial [Danio rerio]
MASGHISRLANLFTSVNPSKHLKPFRGLFLSSVSKSTVGGSSIHDDSNVEIAVTSDGNTIVCFHPADDVPYELTQPIVRPDAISGHAETHEQVLKDRLGKAVLADKKAPTIEELSKMFYTTKHRWYPVGQFHNRRRKLNPPKDR